MQRRWRALDFAEQRVDGRAAPFDDGAGQVDGQPQELLRGAFGAEGARPHPPDRTHRRFPERGSSHQPTSMSAGPMEAIAIGLTAGYDGLTADRKSTRLNSSQ